MNNFVFATNINAILQDGSEATDIIGMLIDNKRVYKLADNTIFTGTKKVKTIKFATFTVPMEYLPYIMSRVNE